MCLRVFECVCACVHAVRTPHTTQHTQHNTHTSLLIEIIAYYGRDRRPLEMRGDDDDERARSRSLMMCVCAPRNGIVCTGRTRVFVCFLCAQCARRSKSATR